MVDSVAFDLLHGGNKQSVQSGVYYWNYSTSTSAIIGTIPQTIYAYNTLSSIVYDIVLNNPITAVQNKFTQNTSLPVSDTDTADQLGQHIQTIQDIIENGPDVAPEQIPISLSRTGNTFRTKAWDILQANKTFIAEEVVARTNQQFFRQNTYNQDKCRRDTGLIVDAVVLDLLFPTVGNSQSTFAGLQYWNQSGLTIPAGQFTATINAFTYAKSLCKKLVLNDTSNPRYSSGVQNVTLPEATQDEVDQIDEKFNAFIDILNTGTIGVTDKIIPNGIVASPNENVHQAAAILKAHREYIAEEVASYVDYNAPMGYTYDRNKCKRDTGYVVDSVCFDLLYGGNKQAIQCGVYYYGFSAGSSAIYGQTTGTIAAYNRIRNIISTIANGNIVDAYQDKETQIFETRTSDGPAIALAVNKIDTITYIIQNGPTAPLVADPSPITTTATVDTEVQKVAIALHVNRQFIQEEVVAYVNQLYAFDYNREKCKRDAGLIVDAITYDLIVGGNTKSIEAGISYWQGGRSYITGQITQTVDAIERARVISLDIIQNSLVSRTVGNGTEQIINPYFSGGSAASSYINMNYNTIKSIMQNGEIQAPPSYVGWGLFAATGISNNDVKIAPKVRSVNLISGNRYRIFLDVPTVASANNATLYFGDTLVFPKLDNEFTSKEAIDWAQRMVDPNGSMGGSLVDGSVVSERSPINSFVYDAFTQVTQGGRGIHIINNGYAQLVSVFTIFCSTHVEVTNGGIASITNSNANFGDYCLVAKGKGPLEFSGTIYNPAYPTLAQTAGQSDKGEFYPYGYWPQNAEVLVFLPDTSVRPHIGLVMEVVPPETIMEDVTGGRVFQEKIYTNEQGLPGFLNAAPDINLLTTGSIKLSNIDTTGIAIGHTVYVRDQFGSFLDNSGIPNGDTGTVVTNVGFKEVTLNKALLSGGGEVNNPNFFTLLFCGNAYYNVLTSNTSSSVIPEIAEGESVLKTPAQENAELDSFNYLAILLPNILIPDEVTTIATQFAAVQNTSLKSAPGARAFLTARLNEIRDILVGGISAAVESRKTGSPPPNASEAVAMINANRQFVIEEVTQRVINSALFVMDALQTYKCRRDTGLILDKLVLDISNGGNYNSINVGLSYFNRPGTHHVISLEDQVRNPQLFPDGATVNFYQRSYMSALGYTFEYVGAGSNYGSLPQVGRKDPVQEREVLQLDNGKVFFTSTDQNGDFRIGPGLVISQATGVLSGRTFTKSLFAQMTPFILAVETGGI